MKVRLGDYIEQIRGVSYSPADLHSALNEKSVILLRANNINDNKINFDDVVFVDKNKVSKNQYLQEGDILVCTSSGSKHLVGKAAYVDKAHPVTFGAFCKIVRPKTSIKRYIGYFFESPFYRTRISELSGGANINNIRNEHIDELVLELPEESIQNNICLKLNKISILIEKRKQQLEKLDLLVKSKFIEMFGDPEINPNNWIVKGLMEIGECKNGINFGASEDGEIVKCIGVGDIKNLSVIDNNSNVSLVALNELPSTEYLLQNEDIIFVRSNGNKNLVGRCVIVYPQGECMTFSGFCIRFRKNTNIIQAQYLLYFLKQQRIRERIIGRGANIQNLNQKILSSLMIPIPPIDLQNEFASFVEQTDKTKSRIKQSLEKFDILKKALMQKYFG